MTEPSKEKIANTKAELKKLLQSFKRSHLSPDSIEQLASLIAQERWLYGLHKAGVRGEPNPSAHKEKVERYIKGLQAARRAWLDLPAEAQDYMHELIPLSGSLLDNDLLRELEDARFYQRKIPEWRKKGLSKLEEWRADIELLDLLLEIAVRWQKSESPKSHARPSPEVELVAAIAEHCAEYGITPSATEKSHLTQIVQVVLPNKSDYRPLIRKALALGG